jgi:hypothetical protein
VAQLKQPASQLERFVPPEPQSPRRGELFRDRTGKGGGKDQLGVGLVVREEGRLGEGVRDGEFEEVGAGFEGWWGWVSIGVVEKKDGITKEVVVNPRICDQWVVLIKRASILRK